MRKKLMPVVTVLCAGMIATSFLVACNTENNEKEVISVTSLGIKGEKIITLETGDTYQLEVEVTANNETDKEVEYISNNSAVATVSNSGLIQSLKAGAFSIIVQSKVDNSKYDILSLNVIDPVKEGSNSTVSFDENKEINLNVGETKTLSLRLSNPELENQVSFSSSNSSIASVSSDGVVTALNQGSTTIVVKSTLNPSSFDYLTLNVIEPIEVIAIESITLPETLSLNLNETAALSASLIPENTTQKGITYEIVVQEGIDVNEIALISGNKIIGLKAGTVEVLAKSASNAEVVSNKMVVTVHDKSNELTTKLNNALNKETDAVSNVVYDFTRKSNNEYFSIIEDYHVNYEVYKNAENDGLHLIVDETNNLSSSYTNTKKYVGFDETKENYLNLSINNDDNSKNSYNSSSGSYYSNEDVVQYNTNNNNAGMVNEAKFLLSNYVSDLSNANFSGDDNNFIVKELNYDASSYWGSLSETVFTASFLEDGSLSYFSAEYKEYETDDYDSTTGEIKLGAKPIEIVNAYGYLTYGERVVDTSNEVSVNDFILKSATPVFSVNNKVSDLTNLEAGQTLDLSYENPSPETATTDYDYLKFELPEESVEFATVSYSGKSLSLKKQGTFSVNIVSEQGNITPITKEITVNKATVSSMSINNWNSSGYEVGATEDLKVSVYPSEASQEFRAEITEGTDICSLTYNEETKVYTMNFLAPGSFTVKVTSLDNENVSASKTFNVKEAFNPNLITEKFNSGTYVDDNNQYIFRANTSTNTAVIEDSSTGLVVNLSYVLNSSGITFTIVSLDPGNTDYVKNRQNSVIMSTSNIESITLTLYDGLYEFPDRMILNYVANN